MKHADLTFLCLTRNKLTKNTQNLISQENPHSLPLYIPVTHNCLLYLPNKQTVPSKTCERLTRSFRNNHFKPLIMEGPLFSL